MVERDTSRGIIIGLACPDALGPPVEFKSAEHISTKHGTLSEMVGQATWDKPAGTTTDGTDLAMCIANSLIEQNGFDPDDIGGRFVDWLSIQRSTVIG